MRRGLIFSLQTYPELPQPQRIVLPPPTQQAQEEAQEEAQNNILIHPLENTENTTIEDKIQHFKVLLEFYKKNIDEFNTTLQDRKMSHYILNLPSIYFLYYLYKSIDFEENKIHLDENKEFSLFDLGPDKIADIAVSIYETYIIDEFIDSESFFEIHMDPLVLHIFQDFYNV